MIIKIMTNTIMIFIISIDIMIFIIAIEIEREYINFVISKIYPSPTTSTRSSVSRRNGWEPR